MGYIGGQSDILVIAITCFGSDVLYERIKKFREEIIRKAQSGDEKKILETDHGKTFCLRTDADERRNAVNRASWTISSQEALQL